MSSESVLSYEHFVSLHSNQLHSSGVPQNYWLVLYQKLMADRFDAGIDFRIEKIVYSDDSEDNGPHIDCQSNGTSDESQHSFRVICINENGINVESDESNAIYLIDHMITYRINEINDILVNTNGLIERLSDLLELNFDVDTGNESTNKELMATTVAKELWKWNQSYSIESSDVENSLPVWYIMDEFGSRIAHSLDPTFRCVPFYFTARGIAYSLLFPIKSISFGEEVTRNYIEGSLNEEFTENKELLSKVLMIPWFSTDLSSVDYNQVEPDIAFIRRGRAEENFIKNSTVCPELPKNRKIKVYSEYNYINQYLRHESFEMTESESEADILWLTTHFKQFEKLSIERQNVFINQFPFEHIITVKDLFAIVCRRKNTNESAVDPNTLETSPDWLATTYNLQTEIVKFVAYFQNRQKLNLDNHWIIKPWNLARSLDTQITDDLNCIIRLRNTVPKVVCKYIDQPVLFRRADLSQALVKFDIRYIVLLRSVSPLKLYVYRNFWLRFSNKPFSLDNFDDYEKHFTVMNYKEGLAGIAGLEAEHRPNAGHDDTHFKQMFCHDFVKQFNQQYGPDYSWANVERSIYQTLKSAFECATLRRQPHGIGHNSQSRAVYGADIMLKWVSKSGVKRIEPVLLEMNWAPDCERASLFYNHFYNDLFSTLFLNDFNETDNNVRLL